jgi:hypothetical protein
MTSRIADFYRKNALGEETIEQLELQDMDLPEKPSTDAQLPMDISNLDDRDLMTHLAEFTAWTDYASAQLGLAVISERTAEQKVELAEAEAWQNAPKSKTVAETKAAIVLDPHVQAAKASHMRLYAYRKMVGEVAQRYERDAAVVSRELTRRTSESGPKARRRDKWAT